MFSLNLFLSVDGRLSVQQVGEIWERVMSKTVTSEEAARLECQKIRKTRVLIESLPFNSPGGEERRQGGFYS